MHCITSVCIGFLCIRRFITFWIVHRKNFQRMLMLFFGKCWWWCFFQEDREEQQEGWTEVAEVRTFVVSGGVVVWRVEPRGAVRQILRRCLVFSYWDWDLGWRPAVPSTREFFLWFAGAQTRYWTSARKIPTANEFAVSPGTVLDGRSELLEDIFLSDCCFTWATSGEVNTVHNFFLLYRVWYPGTRVHYRLHCVSPLW